ncbi:DASH family cryptochrome [Flavobacteriaceae bacterium]|nr:DASH family cryptochrome [Flavobacteriaceae bacterium]
MIDKTEIKNTTGLVWFGNDLRIHDNDVLSLAVKNHSKVIGIYIIDPSLFEENEFGFKKMDVFRAQFLLESLHDLKHQLFTKNISLLVFLDKPEIKLKTICDSYQIDAIYKQKEWTHEENISKIKVQKSIHNTIQIIEVYNQFLYHPEDVNVKIENIPQVFSNLRKKLEKYVAIRATTEVQKLNSTNIINTTNHIPTLNELGFKLFEKDKKTAFPFHGGESESLKRLHNYFFETKKLGFYKKTRNGLIGTDYSSKFSPWLANGSLSARTIYWNVKKFEKDEIKNQSTYWLIFELIWRDYFKYISLKHGNNIFKIGGILNKNYSWSSNRKIIQNWINGETKDDFVNANMIELKRTGWMSNRGRQNVASYFAKELTLDWRIGAAYFESILLDYDVHSNFGNWMYVSGVGNDPRDRKFNTQLQAERYDPAHLFRNRWLQQTLF